MKTNMKYRIKNTMQQLGAGHQGMGPSAPARQPHFTHTGDDDVPEDTKSNNPFTMANTELDPLKLHDKTLSEFDEFEREIHQRVNYMASLTEGNERKTVRFNLKGIERSFSESDIHDMQSQSDSLSSGNLNSSVDLEPAEEYPRSSSLFGQSGGTGQKSTATSYSEVTVNDKKEN